MSMATENLEAGYQARPSVMLPVLSIKLVLIPQSRSLACQ